MGRGFLMLVLWMFSFNFTVYSNTESDALVIFKSNVSDPNHILETWETAFGDNPCVWFNVECNSDNSVTRIDLGDANLSGHLVPQLGSLTNLQYLELYNNSISGKIPAALGNLASLVSLDLYNNKLSGPIPEELGKLLTLRFLRLNNNTLSGTVPMSLTTISTLQVLDLSYNNLSGTVPVNGSFEIFNQTSFLGNPYLNIETPPTSSQPKSHAKGKGAIAGGIAAALSFAGIATALIWWQRRKKQDHFFEEDCEGRTGQPTRFSLKVLQVATDNFNPENIVGAGGFGKVYKGCLADGSLVAVKRLKATRNKVEELQFQTEVEMISTAVHRNIIHLRGFCMTRTEKLLVYPYMANGSVASCLRVVCQGSQPLLDWPKRKQIALGSARGLAYLHHQCDPKVIHRDVKAANVLLDDEFEAVVGDFGLAKLMGLKDTHVTTAVRGTIGHIAPEYFSIGKCSEKTDIFGYGIMLLELISGQKATDLAQLAIDDGSFLLHDWAKGLLNDKNSARLVDGNLQGNYVEEEAEQLVQVALLCTHSSPILRPTMLEVLEMLEGGGLKDRWEEWLKQDVLFQNSNHVVGPNGGWTVDSTSKLTPDELSGPR